MIALEVRDDRRKVVLEVVDDRRRAAPAMLRRKRPMEWRALRVLEFADARCLLTSAYMRLGVVLGELGAVAVHDRATGSCRVRFQMPGRELEIDAHPQRLDEANTAEVEGCCDPRGAVLERLLIAYARMADSERWSIVGPAFAPGWSLPRWRVELMMRGSSWELIDVDEVVGFLGGDWASVTAALDVDVAAACR